MAERHEVYVSFDWIRAGSGGSARLRFDFWVSTEAGGDACICGFIPINYHCVPVDDSVDSNHEEAQSRRRSWSPPGRSNLGPLIFQYANVHCARIVFGGVG